MVEAPPAGPVLPPRRRKSPRVLSEVMDETEHSGPFPPAGKEELYQSTLPVYHSTTLYVIYCMYEFMFKYLNISRLALPVPEGWAGGVSNTLLFLPSLVGETKASHECQVDHRSALGHVYYWVL